MARLIQSRLILMEKNAYVQQIKV